MGERVSEPPRHVVSALLRKMGYKAYKWDSTSVGWDGHSHEAKVSVMALENGTFAITYYEPTARFTVEKASDQ
jgi:hypothetical protein